MFSLPGKYFTFVACFLYFTATSQKSIAQQPMPLEQLPIIKNKFIVVAHRGSHLTQPENTLEAFVAAIDEGADYVEIDLRTSKDGELVIMHDRTLDRVTNGKGLVSDMTLENLKKLTVKNILPNDSKNYSIPTFREVLQVCKDKINIYLDFKDASASDAYSLIKEYGMEKQVIVYINKESQFKDWRTVAPEMPVIVSPPQVTDDIDSLVRFVTSGKINVLDGNYKFYTSEIISIVNKAGAIVVPDIQSPDENPEIWNKAIESGVQGLQTDHPKQLVEYLKKINHR